MGSQLRHVPRATCYVPRAAVLALALLTIVPACRQRGLPADARRATSTTVRELAPAPGALALPLRPGSVRFAVIGDSGRGDAAQREVGAQMAAWRARFPFDFVLMLGDNIYGPHAADDYEKRNQAAHISPPLGAREMREDELTSSRDPVVQRADARRAPRRGAAFTSSSRA